MIDEPSSYLDVRQRLKAAQACGTAFRVSSVLVHGFAPQARAAAADRVLAGAWVLQSRGKSLCLAVEDSNVVMHVHRYFACALSHTPQRGSAIFKEVATSRKCTLSN